jgi:excisionase family DNA binding protein
MKSPAINKQLYTAEEVAARLNLHVKTVRRFIRDGKLRAKRIGKQYRITRAALEEFAGAPPAERPPVSRIRRVIVSSIIDIDAISPDHSHRITTLIMASLNASRGDAEFPQVDSMYDTERARLRIMITASPILTCDLIKTINALEERIRA